METRGTVLPHSGEKGQPNFELVEQRSAGVGQIGLSRGELLPGHHRVASCRTPRFSGGALGPAAATGCWAAGVVGRESSWTAGTFILCYRAASNSSTTLPSGSSSKICLPPGPTTTSLRKRRPARFISATRDTRSSISTTKRFHPPGSGRRRDEGSCVTRGGNEARSEEHTSELQSQSNLVCRLLLEKKKKKRK